MQNKIQTLKKINKMKTKTQIKMKIYKNKHTKEMISIKAIRFLVKLPYDI